MSWAMLCKLLENFRAGEPEPERPEPHDLAGTEGGTILFFLQEPEREPEHFKKIKWRRSWSRSWHKLVRLQQFLKVL